VLSKRPLAGDDIEFSAVSRAAEDAAMECGFVLAPAAGAVDGLNMAQAQRGAGVRADVPEGVKAALDIENANR